MTATLRYMGSKRSLAPAIGTAISSLHPRATVADAFAGTCAIGTALAPRHRIIANDIQAYAEVIARALLVAPGPVPSRRDADAGLRPAYARHFATLSVQVGDRLRQERKALSRLSAGEWRPLFDFSRRELGRDVPERLDEPYSVCTSYYASSYFGLEQAIALDSLRFAIDQAPARQRAFYLAAFLHAASHCGAAPGHFAQFFVPRDEASTRNVARYRMRSVFARFLDSLGSMQLPQCVQRTDNGASCDEASSFLRGLVGKRESGGLVIYADPPYSKAQYSRYYHVLESLIRYDRPEVTGKGRYRTDRENTDFSRIAKVESAMEDLIAAAASTGAPLFLSYPANGLLFKAGVEPLEMLQAYYKHARVMTTVVLAHSTMGAAPGTSAINVTEKVYYARH